MVGIASFSLLGCLAAIGVARFTSRPSDRLLVLVAGTTGGVFAGSLTGVIVGDRDVAIGVGAALAALAGGGGLAVAMLMIDAAGGSELRSGRRS